MSPREFTRHVNEICKGSDYETVKAAGIKLINDGLGDFAELYLLGIETLIDRLQQLKPARKQFGPPTTESIERAARDAGMQGEAL